MNISSDVAQRRRLRGQVFNWPRKRAWHHFLSARVSVAQLEAPVAKAEFWRNFILGTKPDRFLEVLGTGREVTCEEADH